METIENTSTQAQREALKIAFDFLSCNEKNNFVDLSERLYEANKLIINHLKNNDEDVNNSVQILCSAYYAFSIDEDNTSEVHPFCQASGGLWSIAELGKMIGVQDANVYIDIEENNKITIYSENEYTSSKKYTLSELVDDFLSVHGAGINSDIYQKSDIDALKSALQEQIDRLNLLNIVK